MTTLSRNETWFCAVCGSTEILHDAIVWWDRDSERFVAEDVLDDMWCRSCAQKDDYDRGEPMFGIPPDERPENGTEKGITNQ